MIREYFHESFFLSFIIRSLYQNTIFVHQDNQYNHINHSPFTLFALYWTHQPLLNIYCLKDRSTAANNILWENIIRGDQQAYRELYELYAEMLYRYGLRYIQDPATIKDCIQDLFTDLYHYRKNLSQNVNIRYYLLRSFRRKIHLAVKKSVTIEQTATIEDYFSVTYEPDAEEQLIAAEQQQQMLRLLAQELNALPARQKEVLFLKFNCELSYDEVAGIMKISIPTCRTLAYRAFQQLRTNMERMPVLPILILLMSWLSQKK